MFVVYLEVGAGRAGNFNIMTSLHDNSSSGTSVYIQLNMRGDCALVTCLFIQAIFSILPGFKKTFDSRLILIQKFVTGLRSKRTPIDPNALEL